MDDIDRAQFRDQQYQDDCERERRYQAAKAILPATGECPYCGEPLVEGRRYFDARCRDDWERRQKLKLIQGVK